MTGLHFIAFQNEKPGKCFIFLHYYLLVIKSSKSNYDAIMDVNPKRNAKTINYILTLTILIWVF